ncbi:hypothetical protein ABL78_2157 [Leptomonas seymouri]|uniref:Uncharacterized protein n=1 Tax=Leptomonas seymouri TaxID=5684 RepID=C6K3X2_LEPSE|nr:conserved hypothetical protein [Leptomonas seymouri]KPI88697.1 hypothetical protein ABL78_2157 [Leptomonas seymouri]|eukprot:KPI88697.1 hypothetical protein ABL78_2157 [Leptomonas seymouri]
MSAVSSPTSQDRDCLSSSAVDDSNDAERQLCGAVDAALAGLTRMLQHSPNKNAKVNVQGTSVSFLRANGIRVAHESVDERTTARAVGRSASGDAEVALRIQLQDCCNLLRKVDGERRHLRERCMRLQREQDQQRAEMEAIHRYSTASHQSTLALKQRVADERQRRQQLEEQLATQTEEVMQLRRVLRALPNDFMAALSSPQTFSSSSSEAPLNATPNLVPDRRFEEAFKDKMNSIVYKRRYRQASVLHQAANEQLEAILMEQQDVQHANVHRVYTDEGWLASVGAVEASAMSSEGVALGTDMTAQSHWADAGRVAALASATFWQSAFNFPLQLPFSTATPQDALIKSLIYHSSFAEPLTQLREHTLRLTSRLQTTQCAGLRTLYMTFNQLLQKRGVTPAHSQCRSLYERQMDKMQRAHRELLYSLIEQMHHAVMQIPEMERDSSGRSLSKAPRGGSGGAGGSSQGVQRRDVGCSVHGSVSVEEYRTSQLKEQLTRLKLQSLEAAADALKEKEAVVTQCATARYEALQALQSLKKLTACVIASVRAQKASDEVIYDPLEHVQEPLTEDVLDDPRLVTRVAEATDLTLTYVRQLARNGNSAASEVVNKAQVSQPRVRNNLAASLRLSSSLTFGQNSAFDGTFGQTIDLYRRVSTSSEAADGKAAPTRAPLHSKNLNVVKDDRRMSAPSLLKATARRSRSKSVRSVKRRQTVPELPAMPKTPRTPIAKRDARGRPEPGGTSAVLVPPLEDKGDASISPPSNLQPDLPNALKKMPAKTDDRSSNPSIAIIEIGFSEHSIRLN